MQIDKSNKYNFMRSVNILLVMQHHFEIKVKFQCPLFGDITINDTKNLKFWEFMFALNTDSSIT